MNAHVPQDFSIYFEFNGENAQDGEIDPYIAGKSLIALSRVIKKYQKEVDTSGGELVLKLNKIYPGSTGFEFIPDVAKALASLADNDTARLFAGIYGASKAAQVLQIQEFFKGFMNTLGQQVALRVSSQGTNLREKEKNLERNEVIQVVVDENNKEYRLTEKEWRAYRSFSPILGDLVSYGAGDKIDKVSFGFKEKNQKTKTGEIDAEGAKYFESVSDLIDERLKEPFDESRAEPVSIQGKFIDYYGMAHKYFFSFQVRKDVEKYGRRKVLCLLPKERVSAVLDMLKPENNPTVLLSGRATRDKENKLDKIKIESWTDEHGASSDQQKLRLE